MLHRITLCCIVLLCVFYTVNAADRPPKLPNVGDTCYLNAMLQCINNMPDVRDGILQLNPAGQGKLVQQTITTLSQIQSGNTQQPTFEKACSNVSQAMNDIVPGGSHQEDATEFWNTLMARVGNSIRPRFRITLAHTVTTNKYVEVLNGYTTTDQQDEYQLTIPVDTSSSNFVEHIKASFAPQNIEKWHPFGITDIPAVPATKSTRIIDMPQYLPIVWIAYQFAPERTLTMVNRNITAPTTLTFTTPNMQKTKNEIPLLDATDAPYQRVTYHLNSAAIYIGRGDVGHYYAYVYRNGQWFYCNDETVTSSDFPKQWKTTSAQGYPYMMFYERISQEDDSQKIVDVPRYEIWQSLYDSIWYLAHAVTYTS